jgi:hypothetical protein
MIPTALLSDGAWAGLFAAAMAIVSAAPYSGLLPSFCGSFVARFARDALVAAGVDLNWATLIAAALVIFVAAVLIRRPVVSPVVMVSALVPLGAALPFFRAIADFLRIPSMTAEGVALLPQTMLSNLGKVFTTTVAIGAGASVAIYLVRALRRETSE